MEKEILEGIECKVCKNNDSNQFISKFQKNGINIVQCQHCGFVFIPPFYRKEIDYKNYKDENVLKTVIEGNDWLKIQRHLLRFKTIKKYQKNGKLFDLGVGWGHFLHTGKLLGYEVEGIEIAEMPFIYAKDYLKLPVEKVDFFKYEAKTNYYDIITMWDVLEHIDNCDEVVEKCFSMLKKGGYLILQVPQIDSYIAKKQKEKWQAMGLDNVNYFSKKTIDILINKKGFKVIKIKSSIEVKHFLMYSIYNKKKKKEEGASVNITASERQAYYNKTVDKPKWMLKIMVFFHNILYNILSLLKIGDEMIVITQKQ
ncbi:MAG: class I SAM-dependent methyltransferase [Bacteroidales bacterium]|nr:class I SAM-dependent methyltransferase [Bacteroidales bacterium]